jgi:hypothetical protein
MAILYMPLQAQHVTDFSWPAGAHAQTQRKTILYDMHWCTVGTQQACAGLVHVARHKHSSIHVHTGSDHNGRTHHGSMVCSANA